MESKNILLWEIIADKALKLLEDNFIVVRSNELNSAANISGIVTRGQGIVDRNLLNRLPKIQLVVRCGVGVDNIDLVACREKQIKVFNTPGFNAQSVAEHTIMLMLVMLRDAFNAISATRNHHKAYRNSYLGNEIRNLKLGIIGYGHIGEAVARIAQGFDMNISYWNRNKKEDSSEANYEKLHELLATSDVLSIHLPLEQSTEQWFNEAVIDECKEGVYVINTARGAIIDETKILDCLDSGKISAYGGDLAEGYRSEHPLYQHHNCYVTPHIGSLTKLTYEEMCIQGVQHVIDYLNGHSIDKFYEVC